uniref:LysR family transcriptional regulator n=1 Tax=Phaeobacter sp. BS34 TaxID=2907240 RepID=UPI003703D4C3
MDIIWLRDFEALTTHKNFSRAAEERNVSQPAFSRRIRALEDEVGVKLINRQTFPLSLTLSRGCVPVAGKNHPAHILRNTGTLPDY